MHAAAAVGQRARTLQRATTIKVGGVSLTGGSTGFKREAEFRPQGRDWIWAPRGHARTLIENAVASPLDDVFFLLLQVSTLTFLLLSCVSYVVVILFFALLLHAEDRPLNTIDDDGDPTDSSLRDCVMFSVQTITTIGRGARRRASLVLRSPEHSSQPYSQARECK